MANIPISSFTAAANATGIGMSGFSLTGSNAQSMLDLAGTWNTSGTPTGLKLNVTDTASNVNSLLMDLQVGGVSRFQIAKNGNPRIEGNGVDWVLDANTSANNLIFSANGVASSASFTQDGINLGLNSLGFAPSVSSAFDIFIRRDAANTLAQRNGVNAQTFRVYNTFTDASNYERVSIAWDSGNNAYRLQTENAGTGAARDLWVNSANLLYLAQGGTRRWTVNGSGHFFAFLDNTYDIGASGASRPRFLYLAGGSLTGTQADSSLSISPTWNTTGTPSAIDLNVTDTASNASSNLLNLRVGGSSQFRVRKDGSVEVANGIGVGSIGGNQNFYAANNVGGGIAGMQQSSAAIIGWVSGAQAVGTADLVIRRDAANTLAQRNGTAAQTFRVYNTFTDASNYERGFFRYATNTLEIGHEAAGTGSSAREIKVVAPGAFKASLGSNPADIFYASSTLFGLCSTAGIRWSSGTTNAGTAHDTSLIRVAAGIVGVRDATTGGAAVSLVEQTAPAAPATNGVYIYAQDNGAGKTQLMARFATGAAQQIAIEP